MSTMVKSLTYRGDVKAAVGVGGMLVFVTVHSEGHPTGVYRLDPDKLTLDLDALPAGGTALAVDGDTVWVGGSDNRICRSSARGGKPAALGAPLPGTPVALALLANDRLAVLAGTQITFLERGDGKVLQTLELPEAGTCLAADPTGQWLAAGTVRGTVTVFDGEGKSGFQAGESAALHEGAVTALLFEPEELRFFSAGADNKLLSTHARGKLEPEDRGRGSNHEEPITALLWGPGDRFLTGSRDKTVKSWPRAGGRPATQKDGIITVLGLALVQIHKKPHLVVVCDDNSFRLFAVEEDGKVGDATHRFNDGYAWARSELGLDDPRRRETALRTLAEFGDTVSIELVSEQIGKDADHALRLLATQLLGSSKHPRAPRLIEEQLSHSDEAVRLAALEGLRKHLGEQDLRPLELALKVEKADVGRAAVQGLEALAQRDDQALARLTEALGAGTPEIRQAALTSLERVYPGDSPEADLTGLGSVHADVRRLALIRLFQRRLLGQPRVQAALRWRMEDADAEVRRTAFLLTLLAREKLARALRARDTELHRQLFELETFSQGEARQEKELPPQPRAEKLTLEDADFEPLLQATASRALDTCLRGARGLAVLGDSRAFGLLLQLSREEDARARAEVCRALAALDDPRSARRLRSLLYDADAAVRDAAFSALVEVHEGDGLMAAEAGLGAAFEDVRRRGLQALISAVRKAAPRRADEPAWQLLVRALNDSFEGVRSEAFKAVLNLQIAGGGVHTLRFVLQSVHADVRLEVLTELTAQASEAWAWNLLLEFYNDHDPTLRGEAFAFAVQKTKELEPLEAGLRSQYPDVRKKAVDALVKKHTPAAQALLVKSLADGDKEVRQLALESLVSTDAREALTQALNSPHADVRVRAGRALARHGDAAALAPLLALASAPEPAEKERRPDWEELVSGALAGLAQLGEPAALPHVASLLQSKSDSIRKNAAFALTWVALPNQVETLRQALQHADPQVKFHAALGLAYAADPLAASLVFSDQAGQVLSPGERLVAAFTLGQVGEEQLVVFLDSEDEKLRNWALLLLMLLEMKAHQGTPARCLACLSSRMPRVRLTAARALESFADPAAFRQFVVQLFNERGDETAWKVPGETIDAVADLLVQGGPQVRARTAQLLRYLSEKEQAPWNQAWAIHEGRFARALAAARQQARAPAASQYTAPQLRRLAFGAYVGLVREQGGAHGSAQRGAVTPAVVRVRQTALSRIFTLASADAEYARAARPVFVQALGDPNQAVRMQAFEHLQALGVDSAALGAEALEAGHTDLGVRGLQLLTGRASAAEGQAVLEQVMLSRTDELAVEAAKLLAAQRGTIPVAGRALSAVCEPLRDRAVEWLVAEYDKVPEAREHLRQALGSRYLKVRRSAAFELAAKKDPAAFDALVALLATQDQGQQRRVIEALVKLGDPRAADAFLDRLEKDPSGTACADELLQAAGSFRRPENADRLLALMTKDRDRRGQAFAALLAITGYDQSIDDPEDERPDKRWLDKQHPRRDALLARLMDRCFALGETDLLRQLLPAARWAKGKEVDPVLVPLTGHPDEELRREALEALGWRVRKRKASAEPLLRALQHKDSSTQFLAAEALARARRAEGISALLAAVDFLEDFSLRARAVHALGELGDARALDALLKLVNEPGHALQQTAAEALGHFGKTEKADEIFKLLERLAKEQGGVADGALKGLRWLNTRPGWQLVRQRAVDTAFWLRSNAVELLGHNDEPATRDLLLRLLATDDNWEVYSSALTGARRLWGEESMEPDYALFQNPISDDFAGYDDSIEKALARVCKEGEPRRLFEIMAKCGPDVQATLTATLLNRPSLPVAEAQAALASPDENTVRLAAQVLGRAKAALAVEALQAALKKWRAAWQDRRRRMTQDNQPDAHLVERTTPCVRALVWALGRLGGAEEALVAAALSSRDDRHYRPVRLEAVTALASGRMTEPVLSALEEAALDNDAEIRTAAADALGRHSAARATALVERLLSDRVSFNRLTGHEGVEAAGPLRSAAGQVHYQGVALPQLVARGDVEALRTVAENRKLPLATRLGAVEGLALMARETAEARLAQLGQDGAEDEELRKAAWRGLRRSKRARQTQGEE